MNELGMHKNEKYMSAGKKRISERSRGTRAERGRGGCGDNRGIDSTRDTPGCFRGLNGSSTTFDNFDNANYKTTDRVTTSGSSLKISSSAEQSYTYAQSSFRVFRLIHRRVAVLNTEMLKLV